MIFFALTFALTWSLWVAAAAIPATGGVLSPARQLVFLAGVFGPSIVAIGLSARAGGWAAVRALIAPVARWRVGAKWYLFAILFFFSVRLLATVVVRVVTGAWPPLGAEPLAVMFGALLISTWVQVGEELGWRGYALPRLASRVGIGPATIVIGIIWAAWHLPLFFHPEGGSQGQSFPLYAIQVTAISVVLGWLYWRTRGSLLPVMLLHAAVNNTGNIVPARGGPPVSAMSFEASSVAWATSAVLWVIAGLLLLQMKGVREVGSRRGAENALAPTGVS